MNEDSDSNALAFHGDLSLADDHADVCKLSEEALLKHLEDPAFSASPTLMTALPRESFRGQQPLDSRAPFGSANGTFERRPRGKSLRFADQDDSRRTESSVGSQLSTFSMRLARWARILWSAYDCTITDNTAVHCSAGGPCGSKLTMASPNGHAARLLIWMAQCSACNQDFAMQIA